MADDTSTRPGTEGATAATRDYNAIMAKLAVENPEAHTRITGTVDELLASHAAEKAGSDGLPIRCGYEGCDVVAVGADAWTRHHDEVHRGGRS